MIIRDARAKDRREMIDLLLAVRPGKVDEAVASSRVGTAVKMGLSKKHKHVCLVAELDEKVKGWLFAEWVHAYDMETVRHWYLVHFLIGGKARLLLQEMKCLAPNHSIIMPCYDELTPKRAAMRRLMESAGFKDRGTIWMG